MNAAVCVCGTEDGMKRRYPKRALYLKEEWPSWPWKLFFALEGFLYLWFMLEDLFGKTWLLPSDAVKYIAIWICFFMALYLYRTHRGNGYMLTAQALILPADLILLFVPELAWLGIILFLAVQGCYFLRMRQTIRQYLRLRGSRLEWTCALGAAAAWLIGTAGLLLARMELTVTILLGLLYILVFLGNCVLAAYEAVRFQKEEGIVFAAGLFLFFLCDIHVGLVFLAPLMPAGSAAAWYCTYAAVPAMWFFYLPGQTLLVASSAARQDGWSVRRR